MSDFDVSMRVRLINQLSRPAEEVRRDLNAIGDAAERLGRTRGGQQLAGDLDRLGRTATEAKGKIGAIGTETDDVRRKLGQLDDRGFTELTADADRARHNIGQIGTESDDVRRKLGQLDDRGFEALTGKATSVKAAVGEIGTESDDVRTKLGQLDDRGFEALIGKATSAEAAVRAIGAAADHSGRKIDALGASPINPAGLPTYSASYAPTAFGTATGPYRAAPGGTLPIGIPAPLPLPGTTVPTPMPTSRPASPGRIGGMFDDASRAAYERTGADAYLPIGMGAGYMIGGGVAAGAIYGVGAYRNYAGFNREMGLLGNAAGVDMETVDKGIDELRDVANIAKLPFADAFYGFKALIDSGIEWGQALEMMPSVARTTTASGAEAAQIAATQQAAQRSMGLTTDQLPAASDMMITGGQIGQFELRDMSAYLPSLLSAAGAGEAFSGLEGFASIISAAQVMRSRSGSASKADAQLTNVLLKMNSAETTGNFADYGVDVAGGLEAGKARGEDRFETFLKLTDEALAKGAQLNLLFRDTELFLGMQALLAGREEYATMKTEVLESEGATDTSFNRVASDAQAAIDLLSNSFLRLTYSAGELLHTLGVTGGVNALSDRMDTIADDPIAAISPPVGTIRDIVTGRTGPGGIAGDRLESLVDDPVRAISPPAAWLRDRVFGTGETEASGVPERPEDVPAAAPAIRPSRTVPIPVPRPDGTRAERAAEAINGKTEAALSEDVSGAAAASMDGYNAALAAEGEEAVSTAMSIAQRIRAALGFTVSPTIAPTYAPGAAGSAIGRMGAEGAEGGERAGSDKRSSATPGSSGGGKVSLTQNISSPNPRIAARKAQREQNRSIRTAQARANYDLGSVWS